jgi:hypothetical protein
LKNTTTNANDTPFALTVTAPGNTELAIGNVWLKTANWSTQQLLSPAQHNAFGVLEARGTTDASEGAQFMQELMVSGGDFGLVLEGGIPEVRLKMSLPGPVPHTVRAAYLNCAGDLVGPGN